jgi:acetylglutamate kinase
LRIVVKLGGSLLTERELLPKIIAQLAEVLEQHFEIIVVHGGGRQIKDYLERLSIPSHFHDGLRVTDLATMEVAQMVLAGLVNKNIVAALVNQHLPAVGLCGGDGNSFTARRYSGSDTHGRPFDYGFVGEVFKGDARLVNLLLAKKYVPVIACIALGDDQAYYNVNADEMAAAVAVFCRAEWLIFLTDVPGIFDAQKKVISSLNRRCVQELRSAGVLSEGMLPKTRACERALENGVREVHIVGGKEQGCLTRVLLHGETLGTVIRET